ncbi:Thiol-disulfide isomerase or thioredoxin [Mariniphaga anaerophila]|uniref:Thiol-disulfide isomerase or thioredoxin n=1 Tax=Mariniphaga anaerophila TaxID=1484053 RepID=A0A1M5FFJ4_9BACT|nr:thioredoxin fold domain-containing protein [Mariniphaga anaerophila]SHF90255.1 Thiol-disulfide isomerase or thioredoxin [Mariniphaga anaerophila]
MKTQNLPKIILSLLVLLLIMGYFLKDNLNNFISEKIKKTSGTEAIISGEQWVDSLFNYTKNGKNFEFTLLQFKSNGCTICKQMEPELEEIKSIPEKNVNVVVLNILNSNSQNVMRYFGISAVPTHLILNKQGEEIYRKYGYVPAKNLMIRFRK